MQATIYIGLTIIFAVHSSDPITFEDSDCLRTIKTEGISLVNLGINLINSSIKISGRFFEALQDVYNTDKNTVKTTILDSLTNTNEDNEFIFEYFKGDDLDKSVILTYTYPYYNIVNSILDEHRCGKFNLTAKYDNTPLIIAPFTAYLMATVLYSPKLPKETNLTYVKVWWMDVDQYKVGTTFLYKSFASSNEFDKEYQFNEKSNRGATFVIDNSQESKWSPKCVQKYSQYPEDKERLYPPGAIFRVTEKRRRGQELYVYADLISED